jgi:hypothetical protein
MSRLLEAAWHWPQQRLTFWSRTPAVHAGSMNFGGSALWPLTSNLLDNLWGQSCRILD